MLMLVPWVVFDDRTIFALYYPLLIACFEEAAWLRSAEFWLASCCYWWWLGKKFFEVMLGLPG